MVEVDGHGVVAQHEAKASPTKPLLGTWYQNLYMQINFLHLGLDLSCLPSTRFGWSHKGQSSEDPALLE